MIEITTRDCPVDKLAECGYTVPDLGEYIKSADRLPPAVIESIRGSVAIRENVKSDMTIEHVYLFPYRPGVECAWKSLTYPVVAYQATAFWRPKRSMLPLHDAILKPDVSVTYSSTSGLRDEDLDSLISRMHTANDSSYEIVEIS